MTTRPNPMRTMMNRRRAGEKTGMPSYCTANKLVLETILKRCAETKQPVLIEATANQVNQYGGYTGMRPADYYRWVRTRAEELGADPDLVILAGDHLGPLTFADLPEEQAMLQTQEPQSERLRPPSPSPLSACGAYIPRLSPPRPPRAWQPSLFLSRPL